MKWTLANDNTAPIITAEKHINSRHGNKDICSLPHTCVIFEIGIALDFIESNFQTVTLIEKLPCFLEDSRCISIKGNNNVCFTRGGYGAPAAVDTLETLRALGAKRIIIVGMCGGFSPNINVGSVIVPNKVLCEEGTSFHYFENIEFIEPDKLLFNQAQAFFSDKFEVSTNSTVTSDAFYRQTFAKEAFWRERGCVGVDMESSALLSVSRYYSLPAVSILLCSDKHPLSENDTEWNWGNTTFKDIRESFIRQSVMFALQL
ncbi:MAG: nucleoside phosphorylase [Lachnospiraceae bacterium]|nr:nucleoside phosphorylase [Lachnospiraceae bacterium]